MKRILSALLLLAMLCSFGMAFAQEEAPAEEPAAEVTEVTEETPAEEPAAEPAEEAPAEEPAEAAADEAPAADGASEEPAEEAEAPTQDGDIGGACGTYSMWSFSPDTGTLTIWGNYKMESCPWMNYVDLQEIRAVVIKTNVISICKCAFEGCTNLTSVSIAETVTEIGDLAFADCSSLQSITIPSGVKQIGQSVFAGCKALTAIYADSEYYKSLGGVLFNRSGTVLTAFPAGKTGSYTVPTGVQTIGDTAFASTSLTSVVLPEGVQSIGSEAFSCAALKSITLPASLQGVEADAFEQVETLKNVYYAGSESDRKTVTFDTGNAALTSASWQYGYTAPTTGWTMDNAGDWYYRKNGIIQTGWKKLSGSWYYFDGDGVMMTGLQQIDGAWYYLGASDSGKMETGWRHLDWEGEIVPADDAKGRWMYFQSNGSALTSSWKKYGSTWYYFDGNGEAAVGWQTIGKATYCFYLAGSNQSVMMTGWKKLNEMGLEDTSGSWYYFGTNGAMRTGWQYISGGWYYFDEDGAMQTGLKFIDYSWYYLGSYDSGRMETGWRYIGPDGYVLSNQTDTNGGWYYFQSNGKAVVQSWLKIGGTWYYFTGSGRMVTGKNVECYDSDGKYRYYDFDPEGRYLGPATA